MTWLALVAEAALLFLGEAAVAGLGRLRRAVLPTRPSAHHVRAPRVPVGNVAKVDAYLASLTPEARAALAKLREQIRKAAPGAEEGFGYGLPGFYQDGPLFYYGAAKKHLALYGTIPDGFDDALAGFERSKGTTKFTAAKPLPAALVRLLVKAKLAENQARTATKAPKRVRKAKA